MGVDLSSLVAELDASLAELDIQIDAARELIVGLDRDQDRLRAARAALEGDEQPSLAKSDRPEATPAGQHKPNVSRAKRESSDRSTPRSRRSSPSTGQFTCQYDCGFSAKNGTGKSAHERFCKKAPKDRPATGEGGCVECPDCGETFERRAELSKHRREAGHWGEAA